MEIIIYSKGVTISLKDTPEILLTWNNLSEMEKAIEIIRNIQESAHVDSATIKVT